MSEHAVYPSLDRIADYSAAGAGEGASAARALLTDAWAEPPTPGHQMLSEATGRHMVVVVIEDA